MIKRLFLAFFLCACDTTSPENGACELLQDFGDCPACADGEVTCTFEETSVTEPSCQGCQAQVSLLQTLCDSGTTATAEDINTGMVCETESPD